MATRMEQAEAAVKNAQASMQVVQELLVKDPNDATLKQSFLIALQRVREAENAFREISAEISDLLPDVTYEIRDRISIPVRPLPPEALLSSFIQQMPSERFPVHRSYFTRLPSQNRDKVFRPATAADGPCLGIIKYVETLVDPPTAGGSEDNFHHLWDASISSVLAFFYTADPWVKERHESGEGSSGILRPDVVARFRDYALFRGEEKGPTTAGDPAAEVVDKMEWTYGTTSIPYLLGYYARAYTVTLCSLGVNARGRKVRNDLKTFNLQQASHRVELFIACINFARILSTLKDMCVGMQLEPDMVVWRRPSGKEVQIFGRKVVKLFPSAELFDRVLNIYLVLEGCPSMEVVLHSNTEERSIVLTRGIGQKPNTVQQLRKCMVDICVALVYMHSRNFMHRDLRWENVVRKLDEESWFIVDFDEATLSPCQVPHRLSQTCHAPEMLSGSHSVSVDIWGIGYLLSMARMDLPHELMELMRRCLSRNEQLRPTAADCLSVFTA